MRSAERPSSCSPRSCPFSWRPGNHTAKGAGRSRPVSRRLRAWRLADPPRAHLGLSGRQRLSADSPPPQAMSLAPDLPLGAAAADRASWMRWATAAHPDGGAASRSAWWREQLGYSPGSFASRPAPRYSPPGDEDVGNYGYFPLLDRGRGGGWVHRAAVGRGSWGPRWACREWASRRRLREAMTAVCG